MKLCASPVAGQRALARYSRGALPLVEGASNYVGGVTAGNASHNASNAKGVTASKMGRNSSIHNHPYNYEKHMEAVSRAYQPPQRRPINLTFHHLETNRLEKTTPDERRRGQNTGGTRSDR